MPGTALDATHDPARRSWVTGAGETAFPIQNLPLGVFSPPGGAPRGGVAIGGHVLDLAGLAGSGLLSGMAAEAARAAAGPVLNPLMALGRPHATALRAALSGLLAEGAAEQGRVEPLLVPLGGATLHLPAAIGAFTDFFTSYWHTERGGRVSRPDAPVPENFKHLPIAYNSRASSVRVSGVPVRRPLGQRRRPDGTVHYGPCESLDFELELGAWVGPGNALGEPIAIGDAAAHLFGVCLLNDWSARDVQRWESTPLGPFLAKTLHTTVSPWIVTMDALAPFRLPAPERFPGDPAPLPYLDGADDRAAGGLDLVLEAWIETPATAGRPTLITATNFRHMYWTLAQMLTHQTSNGCNLVPGDLIGSGTASGPTPESRACLAEIAAERDVTTLPNGETRKWLEDGDTLILRGRAERTGHASIGLGECRATILPAPGA